MNLNESSVLRFDDRGTHGHFQAAAPWRYLVAFTDRRGILAGIVKIRGIHCANSAQGVGCMHHLEVIADDDQYQHFGASIICGG